MSWPPGEPQVAPSVLSADFARLGELTDELIAAGARLIHIDVMDGHFVPPLSMGPPVVEALAPRARAAGVLLDVHLMVDRPERHVAAFASAGADIVTVHAEATPHLHYALAAVHDAGCRAGVAICPSTPVEALAEVVAELDVALSMTVNPGWGGQRFIATSPAKVARLRALVGAHTAIEVDGGVDVDTAGACAAAGATLLVAGSAVFGAGDPAAGFRAITEAARGETAPDTG